MKHLKVFEEFDISNIFRRKKKFIMDETPEEDTEKEVYVSQGEEIMIDRFPYKKNEYGQDEFGVYINKEEKTYYIGDLRSFGKNSRYYINYLKIDNYKEKDPTGQLVIPNEEQMKVINNELNEPYISSKLLDKPITLREFLEEEGVLNPTN